MADALFLRYSKKDSFKMNDISKQIQVQCDCGEMVTIDLADEKLYWEVVETDEREMGTERLHESDFEVDCKKCDEAISITLHVWEYPEGFDNMDEIIVDGGTLVSGCDLGELVLGDYGEDEE